MGPEQSEQERRSVQGGERVVGGRDEPAVAREAEHAAQRGRGLGEYGYTGGGSTGM